MSGRRHQSLPQQQQQQQQQPSLQRCTTGGTQFSVTQTARGQQQQQRQQQLHQQMAECAHQLQKRRRAVEATRERLQRDLQDRRRTLEGAFRWLEDVLAAQRRQRLSETEQLERNCRRLLDRRVGELRATRDALVARLSEDAGASDAEGTRLLETAASALELGSDAQENSAGKADVSGADRSAEIEAVEQLRLSQHRWLLEFEAWLKTMPTGPASPAGPQLPIPSAREAATSAVSEYYSLPASDLSSEGPISPRAALMASTAHQAVHPNASWPASAQPTGSLTATANCAAAEELDGQQSRYWSPSAATASRRGFFDQNYQENQVYHLQHHLPKQLQQQQQQQQQQQPPQQQPPQQQQQRISTSGCPVSIAFAGPPENLIYVAEEFEEDRLNDVNIYTARGRLVSQLCFNLTQEVNPYRLAWCPQSQRLLVLSYAGRHSTRPFLVDRRGRPAEPFTSATRTLNLASLEPMDIVTADPPGLAFLCCPSKGLLLMDLQGRQMGCHQLGLGAPVSAGWSGSTQQLAVLHSKAQPSFCLSLFSLVEGPVLRLSATSAVDFESIDPPLVIWDGPRVLVVKVANDGAGGCLDIYSAEPGCQPVLEATRLLWQGGVSRSPIHCCVCLHDGQRMLCICDRNHPTVLICLV